MRRRKSIHGPIPLGLYQHARRAFLAQLVAERRACRLLEQPSEAHAWLRAEHRRKIDKARRNLVEIRLQRAEGRRLEAAV